MVEIRKTDTFARWLAHLRDDRAVAIIAARILRLQMGLAGDVRPVGSGVSELRIDSGPGYRVYFTRRGTELILLLCGGDKCTQAKDIAAAKALAARHKDLQ